MIDTKMKIVIQAVGEKVEFTIGNSTLTLDYKDAITIGDMMRFQGKKAKLIAGDFSKNMNTIAELKDIEENYKTLVQPNNKYGSDAKGIGGGR